MTQSAGNVERYKQIEQVLPGQVDGDRDLR
jgi:hypothetical protein